MPAAVRVPREPARATMSSAAWPLVVFDAFGVLYQPANSATGLLIPYLRELGCAASSGDITELLRATILGRMSTAEFWAACGVVGDDREFCARHTLPGGATGPRPAV
jgi:putative hydrolase of the HAD superfamily